MGPLNGIDHAESRLLDEIRAHILALGQETEGLLAEIVGIEK